MNGESMTTSRKKQNSTYVSHQSLVASVSLVKEVKDIVVLTWSYKFGSSHSSPLHSHSS